MAAAAAISICSNGSTVNGSNHVVVPRSTLVSRRIVLPFRQISTLALRGGSGSYGQSRVLVKATTATPSTNTTTTGTGSNASSSRGLEVKPTILVAEKLGEAGLDLLRSFANVDCSYNLSQEELCTKISLCDAIIVRSGTKVTRDVFESSGGRLHVVGRAGVGIDNVDLAAATEYGCLVVNAPTANTIAAAEHGIALLSAMARNVAQADASLKAGTTQFLIEFFSSSVPFYIIGT